jgi:hypothetical protein
VIELILPRGSAKTFVVSYIYVVPPSSTQYLPPRAVFALTLPFSLPFALRCDLQALLTHIWKLASLDLPIIIAIDSPC